MINVTIVGNLGSDAELKEAGTTSVLNFSLASNSRQKIDGEWQEKVTWVRVALFGSRADSLAEHLTKGKQVAVRGELSAREYTTKDGEVRSSLECRADEIKLLGSRGDETKKGEVAESTKTGPDPVSKSSKKFAKKSAR